MAELYLSDNQILTNMRFVTNLNRRTLTSTSPPLTTIKESRIVNDIEVQEE